LNDFTGEINCDWIHTPIPRERESGRLAKRRTKERENKTKQG
jgi:hypothetical protein